MTAPNTSGLIIKATMRTIRLAVTVGMLFMLTAHAAVRYAAEAEEEGSVTRNIVFLGDSLTAGFELPLDQSYPSLIEARIKAEGLDRYSIVNAGVSGDTSAGGLRRLDWLLRRQIDVLVIALGANDGLRGVDPAETRANLAAIIDKARAKYPQVKIVLTGILLPPNFGFQHTEAFKAMYPELAREKNTELVPFLLEGVAGNPALNLPDGMHPNAEGYRIVAANVWKILKPLL